MKDCEVISIFIATTLGGIVYWLYLYGQYMLNDLINDIMPYDAIFFLLPITLFSWVGCFFILIPIYMLLKKLNKIQLVYFLILPPLSGALIQAILMGKWTLQLEFYFGSFLSGIVGGLIFYYLIKNWCSNKII